MTRHEICSLSSRKSYSIGHGGGSGPPILVTPYEFFCFCSVREAVHKRHGICSLSSRESYSIGHGGGSGPPILVIPPVNLLDRLRGEAIPVR
jgi:hypothetical protein